MPKSMSRKSKIWKIAWKYLHIKVATHEYKEKILNKIKKLKTIQT
jgi:hypothetical protein